MCLLTTHDISPQSSIHNRNQMLAKLTEVRQEAVQQALAALKNRPKPSLPMPSKRSSVFNRSPERGDEHDSGNCLSLYHLITMTFSNTCCKIY